MTVHPSNPDFAPPPDGIRAEWQRMRASPVGLERPLLVLSGWRAPAFPGLLLARNLRLLTGGMPERADGIAFTFCNHMETAVCRIAAAARAKWPGAEGETAELDVVGISMGGLVARAAAMADASGRRPRLRIRRLFTLGTPHRGARITRWIRPDPACRAMRAGSGFLTQLDEALAIAEYELFCYARLGDSWVGATNTAPHNHEPFWKPGPLLMSHQTISHDALIATDIARRLRGEPPLAVRPSHPPRD